MVIIADTEKMYDLFGWERLGIQKGRRQGAGSNPIGFQFYIRRAPGIIIIVSSGLCFCLGITR